MYVLCTLSFLAPTGPQGVWNIMLKRDFKGHLKGKSKKYFVEDRKGNFEESLRKLQGERKETFK